jgi:hypothetical protein
MLNAEQLRNAPLSVQVEFWNRWNAYAREDAIQQVSIDQRDVVLNWLDGLRRRTFGYSRLVAGRAGFVDA